MRTTLTIDDDVLEAARTLAEGSGNSLSAVITELLRRGLQPRPPADQAGPPTFEVPQDARLIPGNRAAELLAEEGFE